VNANADGSGSHDKPGSEKTASNKKLGNDDLRDNADGKKADKPHRKRPLIILAIVVVATGIVGSIVWSWAAMTNQVLAGDARLAVREI
jgi:hypothetical protein